MSDFQRAQWIRVKANVDSDAGKCGVVVAVDQDMRYDLCVEFGFGEFARRLAYSSDEVEAYLVNGEPWFADQVTA